MYLIRQSLSVNGAVFVILVVAILSAIALGKPAFMSKVFTDSAREILMPELPTFPLIEENRDVRQKSTEADKR